MAIALVERQWCTEYGDERKSFILDTAEDVYELPVCCPGSMAAVAEKDGAAFMVNASGEWKEV